MTLSRFHKRRDRLKIMADILKVAREGALPTHIMYRAELSFAQKNKYLQECLDLKLLEIISGSENDPRNRLIYRTTSKGRKFLRNYRELRQLLKPEKEGSSGLY